MIRSEQALKREGHNFDKRMLKQSEQGRKAFKKLCQQEFACDVDAQKAFEQWESKQPYLKGELTIIKVPVFNGAGRPSLNQKPEREYFQITGNLYTALSKREDAQQKLGLFIIASNDLSSELTMEKMLSTYKSQQSVEKGFRFLKSPDFLTSAIYLKKPERIEALLMVMTTCLMIYAALEHEIRKQLKEQNRYFPDMKKKPYQRPTARWVFQCFQGVTVLTIEDKTQIVVNLKERQQTIIDCLGDIYGQIYS